MRRLLAPLSVLAVCAATVAASADDVGGSDFAVPTRDKLGIRADAVEYEEERALYIARGNVRLEQAGRTLSADWMAFSQRTGVGVASGNVVYTDEEDTIRAGFAEFDMQNLEGIVFDARFDTEKRGFKMAGAEIEKTGDDTWAFKEGVFTTCRCPEPEDREPWTVKAQEAELEVGGYGTAKNSTVEVLGIPVLWLPWMIYPIKTERQTGLLMPEIGFDSRNGFEIGLPVFFAAGDPVNVTVTPQWLSERGFKGDVALDYVVGEQSGGGIDGVYVRDDKVNANSIQSPFGADRWATWGRQDQWAPADVRLKTDFTFLSDNAFVLDFQDLGRLRRNRFIESHGFGGRAFGGAGATGILAGAEFADDQQSPDDLDRDRYLLQRLPTADVRRLAARVSENPWLSWLAPAIDVEYSWFQGREDAVDQLGRDNLSANGLFLDTGVDAMPDTRNGAVFERNTLTGVPEAGDPSRDDFIVTGGTERNGVFDEGEPLVDQGHRILFTPRIGGPQRLFDFLDVYPEVGWHQTLYQTDQEGFEQRGFLTAQVDVSTPVRGSIFGLEHWVEPHLAWTFVHDTNDRDKPLFVPGTAIPQSRLRQLALENVTLDPADRIRDFNGLTLSVENRLYKRGAVGEASRLVADFVVSGQYDFENSEFTRVLLDGTAYPMRRSEMRLSLGFDPERPSLTEAWADVVFKFDAGHRVGILYRYLRDVPNVFENFEYNKARFKRFDGQFESVNELSGFTRFQITDRWSLRYGVEYSFERSLLLSNRGSIEYVSACNCWAAGVEVRQDRAGGVNIRLIYRLVGLGDGGRSSGIDAGPLLDGFGGV